MKRFILWTIIFFGFFLTIQTLRVANQQKNISKVNLKQFKNKEIKIVSPDLFAEKNIIETFEKRYGVPLKFRFINDEGLYSGTKEDFSMAVYPSFAYDSLIKSGKIAAIDATKVSNLSGLMAYFSSLKDSVYSAAGKTYAIPVSYMPYAVFINREKVKFTTSGKGLLSQEVRMAFSDDVGSLLTLLKIFKLPVKESSLGVIKKKFKKENIFFFNPDDPIGSIKKLMEFKPDIILGPAYIKNPLEREAGTLDMVMPEEGVYSTVFLVSPSGNLESELASVFLNHITDPLIQRNLTEVMGMGITNGLSMKSMAPVLYNSLKMNDEEYLKNMHVLKDQKEYEAAVKLLEIFKK